MKIKNKIGAVLLVVLFSLLINLSFVFAFSADKGCLIDEIKNEFFWSSSWNDAQSSAQNSVSESTVPDVITWTKYSKSGWEGTGSIHMTSSSTDYRGNTCNSVYDDYIKCTPHRTPYNCEMKNVWSVSCSGPKYPGGYTDGTNSGWYDYGWDPGFHGWMWMRIDGPLGCYGWYPYFVDNFVDKSQCSTVDWWEYWADHTCTWPDGDTSNFSVSEEFRSGMCCDANGNCDMDSLSYTCDLNDYVAGKDSCNNIDEDGVLYDKDGDGTPEFTTDDTCCGEVGDVEKYVLRVTKLNQTPATPEQNALCTGSTIPFTCNMIDSCYWDSGASGGIGMDCRHKPSFDCENELYKEVCSECVVGNEENDCAGFPDPQCCRKEGGEGVCISKKTNVCCGPENCGEKLSRSSWPVESGGICYKPGANSDSFSVSSGAPDGWLVSVSDNYNVIAGDLAIKYAALAEAECTGRSVGSIIDWGAGSLSTPDITTCNGGYALDKWNS